LRVALSCEKENKTKFSSIRKCEKEDEKARKRKRKTKKKDRKEMIKNPNLGTWEGHQCEIKVFP
jgi:hypothetical protein